MAASKTPLLIAVASSDQDGVVIMRSSTVPVGVHARVEAAAATALEQRDKKKGRRQPRIRAEKVGDIFPCPGLRGLGSHIYGESVSRSRRWFQNPVSPQEGIVMVAEFKMIQCSSNAAACIQ